MMINFNSEGSDWIVVVCSGFIYSSSFESKSNVQAIFDEVLFGEYFGSNTQESIKIFFLECF